MSRSKIPAFLLVAALVASPAWGSDLSALDQEFDLDALKGWTELSTVEGWPSKTLYAGLTHKSPGRLHFEPDTSCWTGDHQGPFYFQLVEGDFVVTTRVLTQGKIFAVPGHRWSLGGLMVRAPRDVSPDTWTAGGENWVYLTTGIGRRNRKASVETKNTLNGESEELNLKTQSFTWTDLRVVRIGPSLFFLYRLDGDDWQLMNRLHRPDFPAALQVGLTAFTNWVGVPLALQQDALAYNKKPIEGGHPDLVLLVDYIRFARPALPEGLDATALLAEETPPERVVELFGH